MPKTRRRKTRPPKYPTWTDHAGKVWKVPVIKDRLRVHQIAGHAALKAHVVCRDGGVCRQCGSCDALTLDHIVSKRNGGTHHPDNLQALCKPCNDAKSNYQDRGRQPTPCGQLDFHGGACARTAGHSGAHVGARLPQQYSCSDALCVRPFGHPGDHAMLVTVLQ